MTGHRDDIEAEAVFFIIMWMLTAGTGAAISGWRGFIYGLLAFMVGTITTLLLTEIFEYRKNAHSDETK